MASGPNLQNVPKRRKDRHNCECGHTKPEHVEGKHCSQCECEKFTGIGIGKKLRRAIIAPEGYYLVRADLSNAENRVILYLANYEPPKDDLHGWVRDQIGLTEDHPFAVSLGGARDAAKSVQHSSNYL